MTTPKPYLCEYVDGFTGNLIRTFRAFSPQAAAAELTTGDFRVECVNSRDRMFTVELPNGMELHCWFADWKKGLH